MPDWLPHEITQNQKGEFMSAQWEYLQDGQSIGPIDEADLCEMLESGELKPATPIRCTDLGESNWRPAKSVPEFRCLFSVTATPEKDSVSPAIKPAPIPVTLENKEPIATITAREEGVRLVKWMWGTAISAWVVCFLPVPGVSTFLMWLFASISGILAIVAMFKNRAGAGIAGTIALAIVTPIMWLSSLAVYPLLVRSAAVAESRHNYGAEVQRRQPTTDCPDGIYVSSNGKGGMTIWKDQLLFENTYGYGLNSKCYREHEFLIFQPDRSNAEQWFGIEGANDQVTIRISCRFNDGKATIVTKSKRFYLMMGGEDWSEWRTNKLVLTKR
jgi:hypothetical protein